MITKVRRHFLDTLPEGRICKHDLACDAIDDGGLVWRRTIQVVVEEQLRHGSIRGIAEWVWIAVNHVGHVF